MTVQRQAEEVLTFWFQELSTKDWFNGGDAVDQSIRERFAELIEQVYQGELDFWLETAQGRLASIITLDQFPRNVFRGTAKAFAYDDKAVQLCLEGVNSGEDLSLPLRQRPFFYLPLEHSELLEHQDLSVERFARLVLDAEGEQAENLRGNLDYAWRHYAIIRRFGRYPHRNDVLGRESSEKEKEFLRQPGSSF